MAQSNAARSKLPRLVLTSAVIAFVGAVAFPEPEGVSRAQSGRGGVAGKVAVFKDGKRKKDHSKVAVYLEGVPDSEPKGGGEHIIHQKDRTFVPDVSVVTTGTTIHFPNDDMIYHNVFSLSRPARFDLGLYRAGDSRSATVRRAGVVDVYCNIHSEMHAKVKVVDTKYYAVTDAKGRFRIDDVPAGTYSLVAWQAWGDDHEQQVTIEPGRVQRLSIRLVEQERDEQHTRKDGTPYGRYK